ncbi:LCI fold-containing protein [Bacillus mexicanus]|uniref:LCI fold-containing protein n=1 Tax=Bacillus mexicanus TaxID=2834415 RepID=UPI003D1DCCDF
MKLKRVLTGSALSLALLVSAAPAFAASPSNHSTNHESVSPQAVLQDYYQGAKSRAELKNVIPVLGTNFYLKDAWQNSDGSWTGHYQGWV